MCGSHLVPAFPAAVFGLTVTHWRGWEEACYPDVLPVGRLILFVPWLL